jgi:hypothetical protein
MSFNYKWEVKHLIWNFKQYFKTGHTFYLKMIIAQVKDILRGNVYKDEV